MSEKTYIAYAIYDVEASCGCIVSKTISVYDQYGNNYKRFNSYEEAKEAAIDCMVKNDCDRWNVI